ncbi:NADPH dehydrogenase NamA [Pontibacter vulgaris]|uniref:NADPH dehydrogenase NamA n=1 Tax=Pontibacter vulgaris TaxID=2905679 RepID=UPI001FA720B2|nr:NADPH dehydrogenase NamA [Pontibacter vulgaris]
MVNLFSPLTIKSITIRNRIVVSPMCQYSCTDGFATDWHLVHLGSRAVGGAGLVLAEATAVSPEGRITADDLGIWSDEHITMLKRISTFIDLQGAVAGIQLAHAGRKASHLSPWKGADLQMPEEGGWDRVAPSAIPFKEGEAPPLALTQEGINKVISDFRMAAERALQAGFKVVEIHAAHGYLFHEFLSPLSNQRTDAYGGNFENRIKLLLEVIESVQQVWPANLPLFVRISATDWIEGGWTTDDSVALAGILKDKGVDLLDCSTGGNVARADIPVGPGYQVPFAERIRKETGILTGAVGMITTAQQAEEIIKNGKADTVMLARELLRDPYFPIHAALELGYDLKWPDQYERAKPR